PDARVLDAVDANRIDTLADAGQRDRQRVHREARVDARSNDRDLGLLRQLVQGARVFQVRAVRIGELFGRRHDRDLEFQNRFHLRHDLPQRRLRAEDDDVGLRGLNCLAGIVRYLDAESAAYASNLPKVASGFGGVDVDAA